MGATSDMMTVRRGRQAKLTVSICFLNEREELRRTVASLRDTASTNVDVLLVNDASTPDYDYRAIAREYECRYIENVTRLGPAACRSLSVDRAETPAVLLVDAHMRFHTEDWCQRVQDAVESNPRTLFAVRCPALDPDGCRRQVPSGLGAWVWLEPKVTDDAHASAWSVLSTEWNTTRRSEGPFETVPCLLGGAYAFDRAFFQEIGGHLGQVMYGGEEPYISTKAWLAGGACRVITDVEIGHIYRAASDAPFSLPAAFGIYNKMVLLATVFPEERFERYREYMRMVPGYAEAVEVFQTRQQLLRRLRRHLHEHVFTRPFEFFEALNSEFSAGGDISDRVDLTVSDFSD